MTNGYSTFTPRAVAAYFLYLAAKDNLSLTHLQLQKLVFLAHGYMLTVFNKPLLSERTYIWRYGPIYLSLFTKLIHLKSSPIHYHEDVMRTQWGVQTILDYIVDKHYPVHDVIYAVYKGYAKFTPIKLSEVAYRLVGMDKRIPFKWRLRFLIRLPVFCNNDYIKKQFESIHITLEA